jgi:hypothetical protein
MNMLKVTARYAATAILALASIVAVAQSPDERAYMEGSVISVSEIRTEPGQFDNYMKYLATTYKTLMDEYKKAGIIVDYNVYAVQPTNPNEPDLILTTVYKNMAAMDNLPARQDPIAKKVWGSLDASNRAAAERGKMRTQLGQRLMRQMILK